MKKKSEIIGEKSGKGEMPEAGFTFVELLIVMSILSLVSLAVYTSLNNGIKIWQRVNQPFPEKESIIFFDKFNSDLRNSFKFTGIDFTGAKDTLELVDLINSPGLGKRTIGKVIYAYDREAEILRRKEMDFSDIYNNREPKGQARSIKNVKSLKFQYYLYDKNKKEYLWQDECLKGESPLAVRLELEVNYGTHTDKFTKTVTIPVNNG